MEKFEGTINKLDKLINKLQANTGGQVTNQSQSTNNQPKQQKKQQKIIKSQQPTQEKIVEKEVLQVKVQKVEQKVQAKIQKKQEVSKDDKKKEKAQKKPKEVKQVKQKKEQKQEKGVQQLGPKDFAQIDIRIGQIVQCWKHPESENLYCQKILVCGEVREIASGLQKFVDIQKMKGKVIVMANLKPRPLAGFNSNGMVVCASNAQHTQVQLIIPDGQLGERVYLQGFEQLFKTQNILPVLNPKKKILEKCGEYFKTDGEGYVVWKGIKCRTKNGPLKATIINGGVS